MTNNHSDDIIQQLVGELVGMKLSIQAVVGLVALWSEGEPLALLRILHDKSVDALSTTQFELKGFDQEIVRERAAGMIDAIFTNVTVRR